jgi:hypothetical protein
MRTDSIDKNCHAFSSDEEAQCGLLDCFFGCCSNDDELVYLQFAQHPIGPGLIEGIGASLVEDDLVVLFEYIARQIGAAVCGIRDVILPDGVRDLPLSIGSGDTELMFFVVFVIDLLG